MSTSSTAAAVIPPSAKYNFLRGHPHKSLLPLVEVQQILSYATGTSGDEQNDQEQQLRLQRSLKYLPTDAGDADLLEALCRFQDWHTKDDDVGDSAASEGSALPSLSFFITSGVSHAVELLCATLTRPGDVVWTERPTYFLIADIFTNHGLVVQSLPMHDGSGGVDIDALTVRLKSGIAPRMIYIIPTHQNPTARTMPIAHRNRLVELSLRYGIILAADEVYHLLDWRVTAVNGPRPARMVAVAQQYMANAKMDDFLQNRSRLGAICSISSFTKIFAPGVRCGWVETVDTSCFSLPHANVVQALKSYGYIRSQGCVAPFVGEIMRVALVNGHVEASLSRLVDAYRTRTKVLVEALTTERSRKLWTIDTVPIGGYFLWITFLSPCIQDASKLLAYCRERGVLFLPGERCDCFHGTGSDLDDDGALKCRRSARICFADLDIELLKEGADLLVSCVEEYISDSQPESQPAIDKLH